MSWRDCESGWIERLRSEQRPVLIHFPRMNLSSRWEDRYDLHDVVLDAPDVRRAVERLRYIPIMIDWDRPDVRLAEAKALGLENYSGTIVIPAGAKTPIVLDDGMSQAQLLAALAGER